VDNGNKRLKGRTMKTSTSLVDRVERMRLGRKGQDLLAPDAVIRQLPLWEESVRGLPNALARSALFTAANRSVERENFKGRRIAAVRGIEILYTGEELRQEDGDVFLQIIHLARQQPLGEIVEFSGYGLLKELGWTTAKGSYVRLRESIDRLSTTTVKVKTDHTQSVDTGFGGSLIRKFEWNALADRGKSQRWRVWLEPEIICLFHDNTYTKIDWRQRLQLPPLAKWLHQFYFSHREPFGYKVMTIKTLCGSRIAVLAKFRYKLREALDKLVQVGFLVSYHIDPATDVLLVKRAPKSLMQFIPSGLTSSPA
jgi:hypothetical protein